MEQEKAILIEKVYPELRSHCREKYGMEFQVCIRHRPSVGTETLPKAAKPTYQGPYYVPLETDN